MAKQKYRSIKGSVLTIPRTVGICLFVLVMFGVPSLILVDQTVRVSLLALGIFLLLIAILASLVLSHREPGSEPPTD